MSNSNLRSGHRFLSYLALIGTLFNFIVYPAYAMVEHFPYGVRSHIYYPFVRPLDPSEELRAETVHKEDDTSSLKDKTTLIKTHKNTSTVSTETGFEIYAAEPVGVIGYNNASGSDDPSDNIFRFEVDKKLLTGKQLTLSYDVYGIENVSGVARSINEHTATGGYFAQKSTSWKTVEEVISVDQLKQGMNHILFTTFENQRLDYKVKNLKLTALPAKENTFVHLADGSTLYEKDGKAYVKGTVLLNAAQLSINGKNVAVRAGEFETVMENASDIKSLQIDLTKNGQSVYSEELPVSVNREVSDAIVYKAPEVRYGIRTAEEGAYHFVLDNVDFKITAAQYAKADQITVQQLREVDRAPLGTNIVNVTAGKSAYRFLPEGAKFSEKVPLTLAYDKNLLPKGYNESDIQVLYFDLQKRSWVAVETDTIALDQQKITGLTDHFTDYMAGVIQAPESPETNSFTPTTISGIQAANPTAGIVQIQPPVANQKGDGTVDFPITVPQGRGGLQPNLSVSYNNNGSSGIVGHGWDIAIPYISVDTRFGVPEYNVTNESEIYQFNGEDLLLQNGAALFQPHRTGTPKTRVTNATFVPKVEGSFSKIVRMGSSPSNYYWVVSDKSGTKYTYGQSVASRLSAATGTANIAKWYLNSVEDKNGNVTTYQYYRQNYTAADNLKGGIEMLPLSITYNNHPDPAFNQGMNTGKSSVYKVQFAFKNNYRRSDAHFNYRYGFKEVNASLLDQILVTTLSGPDTTTYSHQYEIYYRFNYTQGSFSKTLLSSIVTENKKYMTDAAGGASTESYTHRFEYHNDLTGGTLFADPKKIDLFNDFKDDKHSVLASTIENFKSWEVNVGAGISPSANPPAWWPFSYGGTINFAFPSDVSTSSSPTMVLLDIDGDGLDDKVVKKGNEIRYYKNLGGIAFSKTSVKVHNLPDLGLSENATKNNPETSLSLFMGNYSASKSQSNARSRGFFTDVNADGLIDYVKDRIVYFNRIDPNTAQPVFTSDSSLTPNVIFKEGDVDPTVSAPLPDLKIGNDLMDVVKVWVAPKQGTVNISGTISKNFVTTQNGVRYSVEHSGSAAKPPYWNTGYPIRKADIKLPPAPWNPNFVPVGLPVSFNSGYSKTYVVKPTLLVKDSQLVSGTVKVEAGDHIYFRVNSSQIPTEAVEVDWDPSVVYDDGKDGSQYSASMLYGDIAAEPVTLYKNGRYQILWDANKIKDYSNPSQTDGVDADIDLIVKAYRINIAQDHEGERIPIQGSSEIIYKKTMKAGSFEIPYPSTPIEITVTGVSETNPNTFVYVEVEAVTKFKIDWKEFDMAFVPKLKTVSSGMLQHIVPRYEGRQNALTFYPPIFSWNPAPITLKHNFTLTGCQGQGGDCREQYIYLQALYEDGEIAMTTTGRPAQFRYRINQDGDVDEVKQMEGEDFDNSPRINDPSSDIDLQPGRNLFVDYTTDEYLTASILNHYQNNVGDLVTGSIFSFASAPAAGTSGATTLNTPQPPPGIRGNIATKEAWELGLGLLYKNWGQFAYKGAAPDENFTPIEQRYVSRIAISGVSSQKPSDDEQGKATNLMNTDVRTIDYDWNTDKFTAAGGTIDINQNSLLAAKHFTMLRSDRALGGWSSHERLYVKEYKMAPYSRFYNKDAVQMLPIPTPVGVGQYGALSIVKENTSESKTKGYGIGFMGLGIGQSKSEATSRQLNEYMDVNGDGYPDIVGDKIQFTSYRGGLRSSNLLNYSLLGTTTSKGQGQSVGGGTAHIISQADPGGSFSQIKVGNNSSFQGNIGGGANEFRTTTTPDRALVDLNGDGLVDVVKEGNIVEYNSVKSFVSSTWSGYETPSRSVTSSFGLSGNIGAGFSNFTNYLPQSMQLDAISNSNLDLSYGFSGSRSATLSENDFVDFNGDGLPDYINREKRAPDFYGIPKPPTITFNTGTSHYGGSYALPRMSESSSISRGQTINASFLVAIQLPVLPFVIKVGGGGGRSEGKTYNEENVSLRDFDGDGYVDIVESPSEDVLLVSFSKIGRTNMLKKITNPTGSTIEMDYGTNNAISGENIGNTYGMPFKKWVLKTVTVYDGANLVNDGEDYQKFAFEYEKGYKDRRERKFLGFSKVKTHQTTKTGQVFRTQEQTYMLDELTPQLMYVQGESSDSRKWQYIANLITKQRTIDGTGRELDLTDYGYGIYSIGGTGAPASYLPNGSIPTVTYTNVSRILPLVKHVKKSVFHYQGSSTSPKLEHKTEEYFDQYDKYGNVLSYRENAAGDNNTVTITYHVKDNASQYMVNVPASHKVNAQRYTTTTLDTAGKNIASINRYKNGQSATGDVATTNLEYDVMGNLTKVTLPKPEASSTTRMSYTYTYDLEFRQYVALVTDAYGYQSATTYAQFGLPLTQTDLNGVVVSYGYDAARRNTFYKGPYNTQWTIKNEFKKGADGLYYAITKHNIKDEVAAAGEQILYTSSFADGLGRIIQTKKQVEPACPGTTGYHFATSVYPRYDEFGRLTDTYLDQDEKSCGLQFTQGLENKTALPQTDKERTSMVYDIRDRVVQQHVHGLNATTKYEYGFANDAALGIDLYFEKITLPEGNISYTYKDEKGRVRVSKQTDGVKDLRTQYDYDNLNQLTKVKDMQNKETVYVYDFFGQKTKTTHPDSGISEFKYDLSGKLIESTSANLTPQWIKYNYNYDQLTSVVYPAFTANAQSYPSHTVSYTYGANGAPDYAAGRVTQITDLTGTRTMKYGKLGEVTEERRTLNSTSAGNLYFKTNFRYDSWGRIMEIVYPDDEKVTYTYNNVGQLNHIENNQGQVYLKDVLYTFFGEPARIEYGNGVVNLNSYDLTQRIRSMRLDRPDTKTFMNNEYTYDKNQNIKSIVNNSSQHNLLRMGGTSTKNYTYDKFNRLMQATGTWQGYQEQHDFDLKMNYTSTHGISIKTQKHTVVTPTFSGATENEYKADYKYENALHPHAVSSITYSGLAGTGNALSSFNYDANGNITKYTTNYGAFTDRDMIWDQQNRLMAVIDTKNGTTKVNHYVYDHAGERTFKSSGTVSQVSIGGAAIYNVLNFNNYLVYPSGYLVVDINKNQYSKHYYIGGKRFVSRLEASPSRFNVPLAKGVNSSQDSADTALQTDGMDFNSMLGVQNTTYAIAIGNNETNCEKQLGAILTELGRNNNDPTKSVSHCITAVQEFIDENPTSPTRYCDALIKANAYICIPVDSTSPGNTPIQTPNPAPNGQADCITELNTLIAQYTAQVQDSDARLLFEWYKCIDWCIANEKVADARGCITTFLETGTWPETCNSQFQACGCGNMPVVNQSLRCPALALMYIDRNLRSDLSNACAVRDYVKANYKCIRQPMEPTPTPGTPVDIPDNWTGPGSNTGGTDGPYDETKRKPIWWYHTDHLGSSSYLTDNFGRPTHYYETLPFGEMMVEHNQSKNGSGKYDNAYKFNGKELDDATGMYYYGARYYDPRISIFVSVDPLAEETMTPYQYVGNNPVNIIDPTGMYGESWQGGGYGDPKKEKPKPAPAQKAFSNVITRYYNGIKAAVTSPVETVAKVGASLINGLNNFVKKDKMNLGNFVARQAEDAYNAAVDRVTSSDDPMYEVHTMLEELVIEVSASAAIGSGVSALVGRAGMGVAVTEGSVIKNGLKSFSGTQKAWSSGATPNSIYTYLSRDKKFAVSNYIYDSEGKVIFQVDFAKHGNFPSGHGHNMNIPGNLGSGHTNHIPLNQIPSEYYNIPKGTQHSTPIGK